MKDTEFYKTIYVGRNDVLHKDARWNKQFHYDGYIVYNKQKDEYVTTKDGFFLTFKNIKECDNWVERKTRSAITSLEMILLGYKDAKADK